MHPIQEEVVERLRTQFGDIALFFWNGLDGQEIGLIWRPKKFLLEKFAILNCSDKIVVSDSLDAAAGLGSEKESKDTTAFTIPNTAAILKRMVAAAEGLIVDVTIN